MMMTDHGESMAITFATLREYEREQEERRKAFNKSERCRATFDIGSEKLRISLSKALLNELRTKFSKKNISDFINEASISHLEQMEDNGNFDPEFPNPGEEELEPDVIIRSFFKSFLERKIDLSNVKRDTIIKMIKRRYPKSFFFISEKGRKNRISIISKEFGIKRKKGRPEKKPKF